MKTFKSIEVFEQKLKKEIAWQDSIKIGGRVFNIYEYGEAGHGASFENDYVYFLNKPSKTMIYIKYICPSWQKGEQTAVYKFIDLQVLEVGNEIDLWR